MCVRTIYHNTYADGEKDVSEKVNCCSPGTGYLCAKPRIEERHRQIPYTRAQYRAGRNSTVPAAAAFTLDRRPPTPGSMSPPGSRGSDGERRLRRSSTLVYDGVRVIDVNKPERSPRRRMAVSSVLPVAPEPPAPRPIPIQRSSTMPYGMQTPPEPTRGRRPIIVKESASPHRQVSSAMPIGPVEVVEHTSAAMRRRNSRRDSTLLTPHWHAQGYGSAEDDREARELRRRRREARERAILKPASAPTNAEPEPYYSSYGSSWGSNSSWGASSGGPPSPRVVGPSPAVHAVKKELRWVDQMRAEQNARIERRPRLERSATGVQVEVKSILKNSNQSSPRVSATDDDLAELYRSVEGMKLEASDHEASPERRMRHAEEKDSAAYMDRLRRRFSMPPRRYTAGMGTKRRAEIWYPEEGRYKYKNEELR